MSEIKNETKKYTEVWGDTVILKELIWACVIGVVITMSFFLIGKSIFSNVPNLDEGMANGYSLLVGLLGCLVSGVINSKLFKPKRSFDGKLEAKSIEHILESAGLSVEEEAKALAEVDQEIILELESLEMYSLLALIPEGSPNYKAEYRVLANQVNEVNE